MVSRVGLRSWVVAGLAGTMLVPGLAMGQQKAEMAKIAAEAQSAKHTAGPSMVRSVAGLKIDGQRKLVLESKPGEFLAQMKSANLPASTPNHKSFGDLPVSLKSLLTCARLCLAGVCLAGVCLMVLCAGTAQAEISAERQAQTQQVFARLVAVA